MLRRIPSRLPLLGLLFLCSLTAAQDLKVDDEWLRIGFYKPSLLSGYKSLVSEDSFFLSPNGRTDPKAELAATVQAFLAPVNSDNLEAEKLETNEHPTPEQVDASKKAHALCRYPARLDYLLRRRPELAAQLPKIQCSRLDQFRRRIDPSRVSLIFSSYFLGNPASAFGHTFLRIHNRRFGGTSSELLDTAVGFAAFPTTHNPVLYAVFGLAGLFPGGFTAQAYYRSVREYNDQESRDLWSYDLALTDGEVRQLVNLVWEMGSTYISYLYFTVNCGTLMLEVLDAAAPRLHLRSRVPFYVLPSDVVHAVHAEPGLVANRTYRPSVRRQFIDRLSILTPEEREGFWKLIATEDPGSVASYTPESRVRLYDAWADYIEYRSARQLLLGDENAGIQKQKALIARASLALPSQSVTTIPEDQAPEITHPVRRFGVGLGRSQSFGNLLHLEYRSALHALTDNDLGLPPNMELGFFRFGGTLVTAPTTRFRFDDLTVFRVSNLSPWRRYEKPKSFRATLGMSGSSDPDFNDPRYGQEVAFQAGVGASTELFTPRVIAYLLASARASSSWDYRDGWARLAAGPLYGMLFHFSPQLKVWVEASTYYRPWGSRRWFSRAAIEAQYALAHQWSGFLQIRSDDLQWQAQGGLRFFY